MKTILQSNKKGLSTIIAYVLLITITLSLSVLVFNWLKLYTNPDETPECPDGVSISLSNYNCNESINNISFTIKNTGRFNITDLNIKVHNRTLAKYGLYPLLDTVTSSVLITIAPGNSITLNQSYEIYKKLTLIQIQPILKDGEKLVRCSPIIQKLKSCS